MKFLYLLVQSIPNAEDIWTLSRLSRAYYEAKGNDDDFNVGNFSYNYISGRREEPDSVISLSSLQLTPEGLDLINNAAESDTFDAVVNSLIESLSSNITSIVNQLSKKARTETSFSFRQPENEDRWFGIALDYFENPFVRWTNYRFPLSRN